MWKAIIIVCALGNPCVIFQEDPVQYYDSEQKCLEVAFKKHNDILEGFETYGYMIENSEYLCQRDDSIL
tara:strand:- start:709 stop:915 length:207 start_codon:yes stop_codon:yes gene_type:complete